MATNLPQKTDERLGKINNHFNMRWMVINDLYESHKESEGGTQNTWLGRAINRYKLHCTHEPSKTLDVLRSLVQESINKEIQAIMDKYIEKYFVPAMNNIKRNKMDVSEDHLSTVCCKILEEAKAIYFSPTAQMEERIETPDTTTITTLVNKNIPADLRKYYKDVDSDTESDISQMSSTSRSRKRPKHLSNDLASGSRSATPSGVLSLPPTTSDLSKWNPDRITDDTLFILGSNANKTLGMHQRGRIYFKHPNLFRYIGDNEDKLWLFENCHATRAGGKAFFLVLEDIMELADMPEYQATMVGSVRDLQNFSFCVPVFLQQKIRTYMRGVFEQIESRLTLPVKTEPNC